MINRLGPPVLSAVIVLGLLLSTGIGILPVCGYLLAYLWTILVPGWLVVRLGTQPSLLVVNLALGSAVGLVTQLGAYFVATGLGWHWLILAYPVALLLPALAHPAWRNKLGFQYDPLPAGCAWMAGAATVLTAISAWTHVWRASALPPKANDWYQDLYYFLGNAAEAQRTISPLTPQNASSPLAYHWYSSAHMAAMADTGADLAEVTVRLWQMPIAITVLGLLIALSLKMSSSAAPGALAGLLSAASATLEPLHWASAADFDVFVYLSPSQVYSLALALLAVYVILDILENGVSGSRAIWLTALGMVLPGAKASALPPIICGLALVLAIAMLRRRAWRPSAFALLCFIPGILLTIVPAAGAGAGSNLRPFATIGRTGPWLKLAGFEPTVHIVDIAASAGGWLVTLLIVLTYLVQYSWLIPAWPLIKTTAGQLLLGIGIAGMSAMMLINHVGLSQVYFFRGALPFLYLLASSGWYRLIAGVPRRTILKGAVAGALTGALITVLGPKLPHSLTPALAWQLLAVATVGIAIWLLTKHENLRASAATALLIAALASGVVSDIPGKYTEARNSRTRISPTETAAALQLKELSAPTDLVATNVHCRRKKTVPACDTRTFWVSGLSERRVLLEGWAYVPEVQNRAGYDGIPSINQPFPDTQLFQENEAIFYQPSPEAAAALRARGVKWLFAHNKAGPVSPDLGKFAVERGRYESVTIYELPN